MISTTGAPRSADDVRARTLDSLGVRPDMPDDRLDRITRLAQRLFGVSMAAVSLIERDRQYFTSLQLTDMSSEGFPRSAGGVVWIPREMSFCERTIAQAGTLVVEDLADDPDYTGHPLVDGEPHARFYAGHPIFAGDGPPLGTICLVDLRPRRFGAAERALLAELAAAAGQELSRSDDMRRAAAVQRGLLPAGPPTEPGWDFASVCLPSRSVGGDFLDWYRVPDGRIVFTVADVMGKGVGAGMVAAAVRAALRTAGRRYPPAEAVRRAAHALDDDLAASGSLVTLMLGRLDPRSGEFTWVDAGHGLMNRFRADGTVETGGSDDLPLGVLRRDEWTQQTTVLHPGDQSIAFSDGLLDLFDGTLAARDEIVRIVRGIRAAGGGPKEVVAEFRARAGDRPLDDDLTVSSIRRLP